jgi:hypothetical protein
MMTFPGMYRYLYYRTYYINRKTWFGYCEPPHNQVVSSIFAIQMLNLITGFLVIFNITGGISPPTPTVGMLTLGCIYFLNYMQFDFGRKNSEVLKEFRGETPRERKIRGAFVWSYMLGSLIGCIWAILSMPSI